MPADRPDRGWQPPEQDAKGSEKMAWINDVVSMGEQYNASLTSGRDIGKAISMISGKFIDHPSQSRSTLSMNREKRALREVVANIADIRPVDGYSSENPAIADFLGMMNKTWHAVYFESKFPRAFKKATQWLVAGGFSFVSPVFRNVRLQAKSARRIDFDVYSCNDALPFQMPDDNSVQGAYVWTRIKFMPEYEAHAKFPKFQSKLRPVARRRYSGNAAKDRISLAERFRAGDGMPSNGNWAAQMDEIRYTTVRDLSVNDGKKPRPMGKAGTLESYVVPFLGQELPTNEFVQPGIRKTRKATEEDCFLYPNLRLFVTQTGMQEPLFDGPFWDWHGMHPLARFSADEWPWEPGYSLAADIESLGAARQAFMRGLDQTAKQRFDPAMMYNKDAGIPRKTMEKFDPYEERGRLGVDGPVDDKVMKTLLPEALLNIPAWAFEWMKSLTDDEDYMVGLDALKNLAKAKIASADSAIEKAQEEAGPIATDISHGMEEPMGDLMEMVLYDLLQYYPTGRIMQYVGPGGVAKEIIDWQPDSLVPSHGSDEDPANGPSIYTRMERVKTFCQNIHAQITPGSLHGEVQTKQKLLVLQMQRSGFMIDSETVAKNCDLPNWGTLPGNSIREKWEAEQKLKLVFAEKLKELATALQPQGASGPPQPANMTGNHAQPGRPPTGNKPAHMKTKGSAEGQRVVVAH
jgi:hypothetical protein